MLNRRQACRRSPAAIRAAIVAWMIISVIGLFWSPLHVTAAVTMLLAMSAGCLANWSRHCTFH